MLEDGAVVLVLAGCSVLTLREFPDDLGVDIASLDSVLVFLSSEFGLVEAFVERELTAREEPVETLSSFPFFSAASYLSPKVLFEPSILALRPFPDLPAPTAEPL